MKRLVIVLVLAMLVSCGMDSGGSSPGVILTTNTVGEAERNPGSDRGWGFVSIGIQNADNPASATVRFSGTPAGMTLAERTRNPGTGTNYFISYDIKTTEATPLGQHEVLAIASVGGREYQRAFTVEVVSSSPSILVGSFSVGTRYQDYPRITVEVANTSDQAIYDVVLSASCTEDTYGSLSTNFRSAPFAMGVDAAATVTMPYSSGFPYFTRYTVRCSFTASAAGTRVYVDYADD